MYVVVDKRLYQMISYTVVRIYIYILRIVDYED